LRSCNWPFSILIQQQSAAIGSNRTASLGQGGPDGPFAPGQLGLREQVPSGLGSAYEL